MCCERRAARRAGVPYQRRPTLLRMLVEHLIQNHQEKKALKQAAECEPAVEKTGQLSGVLQEGRVSAAIGEWGWMDEKKQLQMMEGGTLNGAENMGTELPSYRVAVGRI